MTGRLLKAEELRDNILCMSFSTIERLSRTEAEYHTPAVDADTKLARTGESISAPHAGDSFTHDFHRFLQQIYRSQLLNNSLGHVCQPVLLSSVTRAVLSPCHVLCFPPLNKTRR